ncbi:centrosomal protein POC5 [Heterocephalus glaber]|uniref:Centrosomal protein POC5 n=1 Tax=Heterocephalus glaber TaxID=10181 RepID=A0AAX6QC94_HETGA|nr:centrosomal protein POC5 [Heterocephalus glaber]
MASNEDRYSLPVIQNNSDQSSSVSTDLQEEYEELLRYAIVTPNIESSASQPSHPKGETLDARIPPIIDNILHNQAGNSSVVRETAMEGGKGCDLNISSQDSKADGSSPGLSPRKPSHPVMDFFSSHLLGDSSSPAANSTHTDPHEIIVGDCFVSDENLQKMENVLDLWSSGLKVYEGKLADQYFQRTLLKKVWKGWHSLIQRQWKEVVERACQARAEEVCIQISNDYETKVAMLSGALENAKAEIQKMQQEKEHFEDSMKKAFMRGVCALNLEAMTIFQNRNDAGTNFTNNKKEEYGAGVQGREHSAHLDPSVAPVPSVLPGQLLPSPPIGAVGVPSATYVPSAALASLTSAGAVSAPSVGTRVPASALTGSASTAEEMYNNLMRLLSSFLSFQQTIPQATAAKYPRTIHPDSSTSASRSLGTRSAHTQSLTSIQSIKVVD